MDKFLFKKPIITEKAADISKDGKYVFLVDEKMTGPELKKIVEQEYKVKVLKTHVINVAGKDRGIGARRGKRAGYKKIIATLQKGQKLDIISQ